MRVTESPAIVVRFELPLQPEVLVVQAPVQVNLKSVTW